VVVASRDAWWGDRNLLPLLHKVNIPAYLGCDWQNVSLHLPSTFPAFRGLTNSPHVQVAMLGEHGPAWPWESLHVEALAWFDHWLKGRGTGILDGPKFRYILPEAEGWRTTDSWPPSGVTPKALALCADGSLADREGQAGSRTLMTLGAGLGRVQASQTDPPAHLTWNSPPLAEDLDVVGDIELQLQAVSTAADTPWIAILQDVDETGAVADITAGYLRASLREVDEANSRVGSPEVPCRKFQAVPIGEPVSYRVLLVANARRFKAGHRVRLLVTSDDQNPRDTRASGLPARQCRHELSQHDQLLIATDVTRFEADVFQRRALVIAEFPMRGSILTGG
jgi:uncharacterized protein